MVLCVYIPVHDIIFLMNFSKFNGFKKDSGARRFGNSFGTNRSFAKQDQRKKIIAGLAADVNKKKLEEEDRKSVV